MILNTPSHMHPNTKHKAKQNSLAQFILDYLERHSLQFLFPQIHETPLAKACPLFQLKITSGPGIGSPACGERNKPGGHM